MWSTRRYETLSQITDHIYTLTATTNTINKNKLHPNTLHNPSKQDQKNIFQTIMTILKYPKHTDKLNKHCAYETQYNTEYPHIKHLTLIPYNINTV